jgi:hypothetical protein
VFTPVAGFKESSQGQTVAGEKAVVIL